MALKIDNNSNLFERRISKRRRIYYCLISSLQKIYGNYFYLYRPEIARLQ